MAIVDRRTTEETRSCILFTAWELFRQLGTRTTVADIAQKLGMSSANVYRFYPSKQALSEAVCETLLAEVLKAARSELDAPGPASKRIAAMMMRLHHIMRDQMTDHARAHEIVQVAMDQTWPPIVDYIHKCADMLAGAIAEGQKAGEFGPGDPKELGWQTLQACLAIHDPALIVQCPVIRPEARPEQAVEFALRALMNRAPPRPLRRPEPMRSPAILITLGAALLVSGCDQKKQAMEGAPTRPVLVAEAHYAPREEAQALPGVVKARIESDLAFRIGGKIATRLVDTGAFVRKGEPLAKLDDTDFRLQLEEAQAEQSSAEAALTQTGAEEKRLTTLSSRVGRRTPISTRPAPPPIRRAPPPCVPTGRVELARNAIDYATLRADADGVISAVSAEPGQVVAAGAPVLRLAHTDVREAAVSIPETLVDRARGAPAKVEFWALPGVSATAEAARTVAERRSRDAHLSRPLHADRSARRAPGSA